MQEAEIYKIYEQKIKINMQIITYLNAELL